LKEILSSLILLRLVKDEWNPIPITGPCDCGRIIQTFQNEASGFLEDRCECGYRLRGKKSMYEQGIDWDTRHPNSSSTAYLSLTIECRLEKV
jgi:hypothetical protein